MRVYYWSNTAFADKVRKVFGIAFKPRAATIQGWDEYELATKKASIVGYTIIEYFDVAQDAVYFIPDTLKSITYYASNLIKSNHMLRTKTRPGAWSDLATRIPDALMLAIIDFVEEECFWMDIAWADEAGKESMDEAVLRYKNQSYLGRKLFPVKVSSLARATHGINYLNFQINSSVEGNNKKRKIKNHPYTKLIAAYKFARYSYFRDLYDESGYTAAFADKTQKCIFGGPRTAVQDTAYELLQELQKKRQVETILHCSNIVKYHDYLWT